MDFLYIEGTFTSDYFLDCSFPTFVGCTYATTAHGAKVVCEHGCAMLTSFEGLATTIVVSTNTSFYPLAFISMEMPFIALNSYLDIPDSLNIESITFSTFFLVSLSSSYD